MIILKENPVETVKSSEASKVKMSNFPHNISFNFFPLSLISKSHKTTAGLLHLRFNRKLRIERMKGKTDLLKLPVIEVKEKHGFLLSSSTSVHFLNQVKSWVWPLLK